jgi:hypothetical protein
MTHRCVHLLPFLLLAAAVLPTRPLRAQNIVETLGGNAVAGPVSLTDADVQAALDAILDQSAAPQGPEARRVAAKLDAHVAELLDGFPWKAFHNTLGISGYEAYFNHPDQVFHALSLALPYLAPATAAKAKAFLAAQLATAPPWAEEGYENLTGKPREPYDVPDALRLKGRGRAAGASGVYAFWEYVLAAKAPDAATTHWAVLKARMQPLLAADHRFDTNKYYAKDEAQRLNGDAAGLVGLVRLARLAGDAETAKQAIARARQVLELRVNLDRVNPRVLEKTESTSARLHAFKLARYVDLVAPVGELLRTRTDGLAAKRLKAVREACPGWWMALGDRYIGGENYTSPPHFARGLFAGAALVEGLDGPALLAAVDVPWCRGDLHFIETCALALWASAGRPCLREEGNHR